MKIRKEDVGQKQDITLPDDPVEIYSSRKERFLKDRVSRIRRLYLVEFILIVVACSVYIIALNRPDTPERKIELTEAEVSGKSKAVTVEETTDFTKNYRVKAGDTLYNIAKRYQIEPEDLQRVNGFSGTIIVIGQIIKVFENPSAKEKWEEENPEVQLATRKMYIVKDGDTLYRIALQCGTTVERIKELNDFSGYTVYSGQTLVVE